jgi:hypothetical protein
LTHPYFVLIITSNGADAALARGVIPHLE